MTRTANLSGGNVQKVLLARALRIAGHADVELLVAMNPTNGLDVGAARFVYRQLDELRAAAAPSCSCPRTSTSSWSGATASSSSTGGGSPARSVDRVRPPADRRADGGSPMAEQAPTEAVDEAVPHPTPPPPATPGARRGVVASLADRLVVYGLGLLTALVLGGVVLAIVGADPLGAYADMLNASLGSMSSLGETLRQTTPSSSVAWRSPSPCGSGSPTWAWTGRSTPGRPGPRGWPSPRRARGHGVAIPVILLGGALCGFVIAGIPAVLRVRLGVSELFTSVMFNFLVLYFVTYLASDPWTDPLAGAALTRAIPARTACPTSSTASASAS